MALNKPVSIVLLAALAMLLLPSRVCFALDPLEGTRWKVKADPEDMAGREKSFDDVLIFKGAKFWVEGLEKRGYTKVNFDTDTRGMTTATFDATIESPTDGKMKWHGSITSVEMSGDMTWTKKDGTVVNYTFKASREPK